MLIYHVYNDGEILYCNGEGMVFTRWKPAGGASLGMIHIKSLTTKSLLQNIVYVLGKRSISLPSMGSFVTEPYHYLCTVDLSYIKTTEAAFSFALATEIILNKGLANRHY